MFQTIKKLALYTVIVSVVLDQEKKMECNYNTFQDYFGLSSIAWNLDDLERLLPKSVCSADENDELSLCINLRDSASTDLEIIRSDAHEDFQRNGVEADLDELDIYQSQLRERAVEVSENPVLQEYLECKKQKNKKAKKICVFCKNNGEQPEIFSSHILKDSEGRILCPILRKYVCPLCGVSGDDAHTIRYCPKNEGNFSSVALLKTNRIATGKRRNCVKH